MTRSLSYFQESNCVRRAKPTPARIRRNAQGRKLAGRQSRCGGARSRQTFVLLLFFTTWRFFLQMGLIPSFFHVFCARLEGGGVRVRRGGDFFREQRVASGVREEKRREETISLSLSFICSLVRLSALRNLDAFGNGRKPFVASSKWDKSRGPLIKPAWLIVSRLTMSTLKSR